MLSLSALVLLAGCEQGDKNLETEDSRNPYFKKAEADLESHNYPEAVKDYEAALRANPNVISAHYELGRIYSDKLGDQINAMYHFHKYLELRPAADNRDKVEALLENEKISFAATLPNSPVQNAEAFARLQSENLQLKKDLEQKLVKIAESHQALNEGATATTDTAATATSTPSVAPVVTTTALRPAESVTVSNQAVPAAKPVDGSTTPATTLSAAAPAAATASSAPAATTPSREARNYTIQGGDSLWKISRKFYPGDTKNGVDKIKQANAAILSDGKPLKIGTVLVIP